MVEIHQAVGPRILFSLHHCKNAILATLHTSSRGRYSSPRLLPIPAEESFAAVQQQVANPLSSQKLPPQKLCRSTTVLSTSAFFARLHDTTGTISIRDQRAPAHVIQRSGCLGRSQSRVAGLGRVPKRSSHIPYCEPVPRAMPRRNHAKLHCRGHNQPASRGSACQRVSGSGSCLSGLILWRSTWHEVP